MKGNDLFPATDSTQLLELGGIEFAPVMDGDFEIVAAGDAVKGGLLKVRQKATRADSINKNRRLYLRDKLQAAVDEARQRARAGAMLCELVHPDVARTPRGPKYVDNPDRKSARVDDISDVGADGWVYVTRTILDTPKGRELADSYKSGKPFGLSTRWMMNGKNKTVQRSSVFVADALYMITFDDVEDPAVDGAGEFELLSDSVLHEVKADEAAPAGDDTTRGQHAPEDTPQMNETMKRLRDAWAKLMTDKAPADKVLAARTAFYDAMVTANDAKEDLAAGKAEAFRLEGDMVAGGYVADRTPPSFMFGSQVGNGGPGWGSDIERETRGPDRATTTSLVPSDKSSATDATVTLTKEEAERVRKLLGDQDQAAADAKRKEEVKAAVDALKDDERLKKLTEEQRNHVIDRVNQLATDAASVAGLVDGELESMSKLLAPERLAKMGFVKGNTVDDPANSNARVTRSAQPWMDGVDKILAAADDHCRSTSHEINPDDPDVQKRRAHNRKFADKVVEAIAVSRAGCDSVEEWFTKLDAHSQGGDVAMADTLQRLASDATTTAQLWNQPTIYNAFIIQSFQDMQALDFVQGLPPGMSQAGESGWQPSPNGYGAVLRIPVEYYTAPTGYGAQSGTYDAMLATPEGQGIDEGSVNTVWLSYAPYWKRIAASMSRDTIRAMGNGPANYSVVGRSLFHIAYDKSRRVDKGLLDEMLAISDEYGAPTATAESPSLANQSSYLVGGSVQVNLNPAKTAVTAIAATDPFAAYGANVVAAIRCKTRGNGTSSPYMGTANGSDPIVRPRVQVDLNAAGQLTSTTKNPFTVGGAGAQVMGYLDVNNQIQQIPGAASPTFAVDWENGVVVFNAAGYTAAGWGNGAGVLTGGTATLTYAYATNFDNFIISNPTLPTGVTVEQYLNGLIGQFDVSAATMGKGSRYTKPNLAIMSLMASTNITRATLFYQLNSPKGTELFPTPEYFGGRTGINMARINAPWNGLDRRILLTRKGSTKYGLDTPFELRGPYPGYDANGKIIAKEIYYGEENSVICTPQVQDQSGNVLNPVGRTIILR